MRNLHRTSLAILFGVLIGTCVFAVAANAQPSFAGKFTLPYEVHWGQAVLAAGQYSIRMNSVAGPAMVTSADGSRTVYTQFPTIADSDKGGTRLTITNLGNERKVRSLNLPALGKLVIFAPLTQSEREEIAKAGQTIAVPVVTAEK
jgi:hypothetical protein